MSRLVQPTAPDGGAVRYGDRISLSSALYFGYLSASIRGDGRPPQLAVDAHPQILSHLEKMSKPGGVKAQDDEELSRQSLQPPRCFEQCVFEMQRPNDFARSTPTTALAYGQTVRLRNIFVNAFLALSAPDMDSSPLQSPGPATPDGTPDIRQPSVLPLLQSGRRHSSKRWEDRPIAVVLQAAAPRSTGPSQGSDQAQLFRVLPKYSKIRKEGDGVRLGDQIILHHLETAKVLVADEVHEQQDEVDWLAAIDPKTLRASHSPRGSPTASDVSPTPGELYRSQVDRSRGVLAVNSCVESKSAARESPTGSPRRRKEAMIWTLHGFHRDPAGEATDAAVQEQAAPSGNADPQVPEEPRVVHAGDIVSLHHVESDCFLCVPPPAVNRPEWVGASSISDSFVSKHLPAWDHSLPTRGGQPFVEERTEVSQEFSTYGSLWVLERDEAQKGGPAQLYRGRSASMAGCLYRLRNLASDQYLETQSLPGDSSGARAAHLKLRVAAAARPGGLIRFLPDTSNAKEVGSGDGSALRIVGGHTLVRIQFNHCRQLLHVRKNHDASLINRVIYEDLFLIRPFPFTHAHELARVVQSTRALRSAILVHPDPLVRVRTSKPHGRSKTPRAGLAEQQKFTARVADAAGEVLRRLGDECEHSWQLSADPSSVDTGDEFSYVHRQRLLLDMQVHVLCFALLLWSRAASEAAARADEHDMTDGVTVTSVSSGTQDSVGSSVLDATQHCPLRKCLDRLGKHCFRLQMCLSQPAGNEASGAAAEYLGPWIPVVCQLVVTDSGDDAAHEGLCLLLAILRDCRVRALEDMPEAHALTCLDLLIPPLKIVTQGLRQFVEFTKHHPHDPMRLEVVAGLCVSDGTNVAGKQHLLARSVQQSPKKLFFCTRCRGERICVLLPPSRQEKRQSIERRNSAPAADGPGPRQTSSSSLAERAPPPACPADSEGQVRRSDLRRAGAGWVSLQDFLCGGQWDRAVLAYFIGTRELLHALSHGNADTAGFVRQEVSIGEVLEGCVLLGGGVWSDWERHVGFGRVVSAGTEVRDRVRRIGTEWVWRTWPRGESVRVRTRSPAVFDSEYPAPGDDNEHAMAHARQRHATLVDRLRAAYLRLCKTAYLCDAPRRRPSRAGEHQWRLPQRQGRRDWSTPPPRAGRRCALPALRPRPDIAPCEVGLQTGGDHDSVVKLLAESREISGLLARMAGAVYLPLLHAIAADCVQRPRLLEAGAELLPAAEAGNYMVALIGGDCTNGSTSRPAIHNAPTMLFPERMFPRVPARRGATVDEGLAVGRAPAAEPTATISDCGVPEGADAERIVARTPVRAFLIDAASVHTFLQRCREAHRLAVLAACQAVLAAAGRDAGMPQHAAAAAAAIAAAFPDSHREYGPGEVIFAKGDVTDRLVVIVHGSVMVADDDAGRGSERAVAAGFALECDAVWTAGPARKTYRTLHTRALYTAELSRADLLAAARASREPPQSGSESAARSDSESDGEHAASRDPVRGSSDRWHWDRHVMLRGLKTSLADFLQWNGGVEPVAKTRAYNVLLAEWLQLLSHMIEIGVYSQSELVALMVPLANILDAKCIDESDWSPKRFQSAAATHGRASPSQRRKTMYVPGGSDLDNTITPLMPSIEPDPRGFSRRFSRLPGPADSVSDMRPFLGVPTAAYARSKRGSTSMDARGRNEADDGSAKLVLVLRAKLQVCRIFVRLQELGHMEPLLNDDLLEHVSELRREGLKAGGLPGGSAGHIATRALSTFRLASWMSWPWTQTKTEDKSVASTHDATPTQGKFGVRLQQSLLQVMMQFEDSNPLAKGKQKQASQQRTSVLQRRELFMASFRLHLMLSAARAKCALTDEQARHDLVGTLCKELSTLDEKPQGNERPTAQQERPSLLLRLVEHGKTYRHGGVHLSSAGKNQQEEEDETIVAAIGCLKDVIRRTDLWEGDDRAADPFANQQRRQKKLNDLGAMHIVINTVDCGGGRALPDSSARTKWTEDVVKSGLELAIALLDKGNAHVQFWLRDYFFRQRDETLLYVLRDRIMNAIATLDRAVVAREKEMAQREYDMHDDARSSDEERTGSNASCTQPRVEPKSPEWVSRPATLEYSGPLHHIIETMRFLQLCCEGHNAALQNYLRVQEDNVHSHDLVRETLKFLTSLQATAMKRPGCGEEEPAVFEMSDFALSAAIQTWNTLTEVCQGPVPANQATLIEGWIGRDVNNVFRIRPRPHPPDPVKHEELVADLKNAAVITMLSVVEGCTTPHSPIHLRHTLHLIDFIDTLEDTYPVLEKKKKGVCLSPEDEKQLDLGYNLYLLFSFLRDYDRQDPNGPYNVSAMLEGKVCFDTSAKLECETEACDAQQKEDDKLQRLKDCLAFYRHSTARIEILHESVRLERVYFRVPDTCLNLKTPAKLKILEKINLETPQSGIVDFFDRVEDTAFECDLIDKIKESQFHLWVHNWAPAGKWTVHALTVIGNMVLLCYAVAPEDPREAPDIPQTAQRVLYAISLLLMCMALFQLLDFSFYDGPLLCFLRDRERRRRIGSYSVATYVNPEASGEQNNWDMHLAPSHFYTFTRCLTEPIHLGLLLEAASGILSLSVTPFFLAILLLPLITESPVIKHVFRAVTRNGSSLLFTMIFGVVLVYMFAVVGFIQFRDMYDTDDTEGNEHCSTMLRCFVYTLSNGLRAGGGIGELLQHPKWGSDMHLLRTVYDMLFFILVTVIFMNIIFGIIVDTFGELRQKREAREYEMKTRCFICQIPSSDFDKRADGYGKHIQSDHNMWHYMYFVVYLRKKDNDELTGQESFVYKCLCENDLGFVPVHTSLALQDPGMSVRDDGDARRISSGDELSREDLEAVTNRLDALEGKLLRDFASIEEQLGLISKKVSSSGRDAQDLWQAVKRDLVPRSGPPVSPLHRRAQQAQRASPLSVEVGGGLPGEEPMPTMLTGAYSQASMNSPRSYMWQTPRHGAPKNDEMDGAATMCQPGGPAKLQGELIAGTPPDGPRTHGPLVSPPMGGQRARARTTANLDASIPWHTTTDPRTSEGGCMSTSMSMLHPTNIQPWTTSSPMLPTTHETGRRRRPQRLHIADNHSPMSPSSGHHYAASSPFDSPRHGRSPGYDIPELRIRQATPTHAALDAAQGMPAEGLAAAQPRADSTSAPDSDNESNAPYRGGPALADVSGLTMGALLPCGGMSGLSLPSFPAPPAPERTTPPLGDLATPGCVDRNSDNLTGGGDTIEVGSPHALRDELGSPPLLARSSTSVTRRRDSSSLRGRKALAPLSPDSQRDSHAQLLGNLRQSAEEQRRAVDELNERRQRDDSELQALLQKMSCQRRPPSPPRTQDSSPTPRRIHSGFGCDTQAEPTGAADFQPD